MLKNDSIGNCFLVFIREKLENHFLWRSKFKFDLDLVFPRKSAHVCTKYKAFARWQSVRLQ